MRIRYILEAIIWIILSLLIESYLLWFLAGVICFIGLRIVIEMLPFKYVKIFNIRVLI